jgi:hypothetical protein
MRPRIVSWLVFLLSLTALFVVAPQSGIPDEAMTRIALTINIVDSGRLDIDRFANATSDRAFFGSHFYADKTPGQSFLLVPIVAADKLLRRAAGLPTDADRLDVQADYVSKAILLLNCVVSAFAAMVGYRLLLRLGADEAGALFATITLILGTPLFGWTTALFAHSLTASFLLFAFALIIFRFDGERSPSPRRDALLLGLLSGYTCVVDLTAAPALAGLAVFALARLGRRAWPATVPPLALGGIVGLLPLLIYDQLAFGSPLHLGYANTEFPGMSQGFYGIGWPSPAVLWELLVGFHRGLLPLSPVLLLVPWGLRRLWQREGGRGPALVITFVILTYFWINAGYFYWDGGWSTGPRQLVPMLALASLPIAFAWPVGFAARLAVLALLVVSLGMSLAAAAASMFAPDAIPNEITGWILPQLVAQPHQIMRGMLVLPIWVIFALLWVRLAFTSPDVSLRTNSAAGPRASAA